MICMSMAMVGHLCVFPVGMTLPLDGNLPLIEEDELSLPVVCPGFPLDLLHLFQDDIPNCRNLNHMVLEQLLSEAIMFEQVCTLQFFHLDLGFRPGIRILFRPMPVVNIRCIRPLLHNPPGDRDVDKCFRTRSTLGLLRPTWPSHTISQSTTGQSS